MLISKLASRMPIWFESQTSMHFEGVSGMGKSAMILRAPAYLHQLTGKNIGIVLFNAAVASPLHLMGFGVVKHHATHSEMLFSDPFFWRTIDGRRLDEYPDGGIIFIDEIDKADQDVAKGVGEMGHSKRIGTHVLPPNWVVWMAGNPHSARYGSKKKLDYLINRETFVALKNDPAGWSDWAVQERLLPFTLAFAETYKGSVFADQLPEKQQPWATPRSLHRLDHRLQVQMRLYGLTEPPDDPDTMEEAEGDIGPLAERYFNQLKLSIDMPSLAEILKDPLNCRLPSIDTLALLVFNTAFDVTPGNIAKVIQYIDRMPREFSSTFVRAAVRRNPKLVLDKALGAWAKNNATLLVLLNQYAQ